ncbi:MAG TPA: superoxide dismutase [Patescibacteria group bacterium]|nr:superoxide dismutase [Patescibacteria group bacterium]
MNFTLPPLPFSPSDLEPHFDQETTNLHYHKHHQAYCDNFNKVLASYPEITNKTAEEILQDLAILPVNENDRTKIKNFGGGFLNHNLFWTFLNPHKPIDQNLKAEIEKTFGSFADFRQQFTNLALSHFGSGWIWLVRNENQKLGLYSLPNQDSPLTLNHKPILNLDVWEHAYYLKYQNRRAEYIEAWWNLVRI